MSIEVDVVECRKSGRLLAKYELPHVGTLGPSTVPTRQYLIALAKSNLAQENLAKPPYDGIDFTVLHG